MNKKLFSICDFLLFVLVFHLFFSAMVKKTKHDLKHAHQWKYILSTNTYLYWRCKDDL